MNAEKGFKMENVLNSTAGGEEQRRIAGLRMQTS